MIKVTLEFNDVGETLDALFKLYGAPVVQMPGKPIDFDPINVEPETPIPPPATKVKGKRGRPRKEKAAAPEAPPAETQKAEVVEPKAPVAAAPVPEPQGPSNTDALVALEKLFSKCGMVAAQTTLKKYGVERLRDLDRKHYSAFVKECHDQVNA